MVLAFSTTREAKEFLIERILSQAKRDGISLSDVESKMLYFSETASTLPDMSELNEEFESHYDQGEFERKVAGIIRNRERVSKPDKGEKRKWDEAVKLLRREDHYLLVLIDSAGSVRPRGDVMKLVLTALAIVCALVAAMAYFANRS